MYLEITNFICLMGHIVKENVPPASFDAKHDLLMGI